MSSRRSMLGSALDSLPAATDPLRELFEACKTGDAARVKKLISPQTVNARDTAGRKSTPLHFAAGYGRREVVEILISGGAALQARDEGGLQPLHNACSFGHADVVRALLAAGAPPAARDNWGYTPLHEAAAKGKVDVCIALLQHGADPNIRNTEGKTPLDLADTATRPVLTDVLEAARSGADDRLASLLTPLNVNVHASDGRRSTALHLAAGYNRARADTASIHSGQSGASSMPSDKVVELVNYQHLGTGDRPLHCAAASLYPKRKQVMEMLLRKGARVNEKNKEGQTPLHVATEHSHLDAMDLLLRHGAKVNACDARGETALSLAARRDSGAACRLLLAYNRLPLAQLLLQRGADVHAKDKGKLITPQNVNCRDAHGRNSTPLHLADVTPDRGEECAGGSSSCEYTIVEREMQASVKAHRDNAGGNFTRYNVVRAYPEYLITYQIVCEEESPGDV
ncbi:unnamed protein product [Leptidea sinapis]|uniref:Uncharacterized protein n=1 Tax=Leptidea sinapis TaxID=189913 RepID=A0A5E4PND8_9NEOP|nr:unnamed protein product [Leptidea sinapis]